MKRGKGLSECGIVDLPEEVLIDILSRLSVKTIVTCRCVSKTWHNLLSSSNTHFTKFHFNRSPVQFILQTRYYSKLMIGTGKFRKVFRYLVELEDDTDVDSIKLLPSKFSLPSYTLFAVNSCNGFLCLASYLSLGSPVKVCNPITGEYLNLPEHRMDGCIGVASGFGCSAKTNQYKVVKLVKSYYEESDYKECDFVEFNPVLRHRKGDVMAVVYTIGTKSWRNIGTAPKFSNELRGTTFFNGAIHWVCYDNLSSDFIFSFDIESEKFGVVPPPSQ